jgi:hypothetical protein
MPDNDLIDDLWNKLDIRPLNNPLAAEIRAKYWSDAAESAMRQVFADYSRGLLERADAQTLYEFFRRLRDLP